MNLALEKRERVTTGDKGRGEIRSEIGRSLEWLQMCILLIVWEKSVKHL